MLGISISLLFWMVLFIFICSLGVVMLFFRFVMIRVGILMVGSIGLVFGCEVRVLFVLIVFFMFVCLMRLLRCVIWLGIFMWFLLVSMWGISRFIRLVMFFCCVCWVVLCYIVVLVILVGLVVVLIRIRFLKCLGVILYIWSRVMLFMFMLLIMVLLSFMVFIKLIMVCV